MKLIALFIVVFAIVFAALWIFGVVKDATANPPLHKNDVHAECLVAT